MATSKTCLDAALSFLGRREHAVKELRTKLLRKEYAAAEVDQTIEKLMQNNMVNDTRYAEARARYRATVSRWGAGRIKQELKAHGITAEGTELALNRLSDDGFKFTDGAKAVLKRHKTDLNRHKMDLPADPALGATEKKLLRQKLREKLLNKLLRKGYSFGEAKAALAEAEADSFE